MKRSVRNALFGMAEQARALFQHLTHSREKQTSAGPSSENPASIFTPISPLVEDASCGKEIATVLVFADAGGATQRISFEFPLEAARKAGLVRLIMLSEADFDVGRPAQADERVEQVFQKYQPTHVIVSRFAGTGTAGIIDASSKRGLDLLVHLDDNLFQIPKSVGPTKFEKYSDPARLSRLRLLCERSSRIYVSTDELGRQLKSLGISSEIIAGKVYCAPILEPAPFKCTPNPIIGYMGTSGHADDLELVVPIVRSIMNHNPNVSFETFGSIKMPKLLAKMFPDRVRAQPAAGSYSDFLKQLSALGWTCGLAPLRDNAFNACKANTKFIEYTQAGIPCVASASIVYANIISEDAGVLASSNEEWRDGIVKIIKNQTYAASLVEAAQKRVFAEWTMESLRNQLIDIAKLPEKIAETTAALENGQDK